MVQFDHFWEKLATILMDDEPVPDSPGLLVKIEANGKRTIGKFINRKFQAVATDHK